MSPTKLQSVLRLHGSKWNAAEKIIAHFPHNWRGMTYVELFGGTGAVLATKQRSRKEVFNDLDGELVNFWRQLQFHSNELARTLRLTPYSFALWNTMRRARSAQPTEILRAAAFCLASLGSKNGLMTSFARKSGQSGSCHELRFIGRKIRRLAARFRTVIVENLPFERAIGFYDSPKTLFYADPPYPGRYPYRVKFNEEDFRRLVELLRQIEGRIVLSCGTEQARLLKGFRLKRIRMLYTTEISKRTPRYELLAMNY